MESNRPHFKGDEWYNDLMARRTRAALLERNIEFERAHASDTNEELLQLVRARAQILGHAPQMCEVTGARMIAARLGGWSAVLLRLGYSRAEGTRILERSERYKAEFARQQKLYRAERREKNEKRMARRRMKKEKMQEADGG